MEFSNLKPLPFNTSEIESEGKLYELHNDADFYEARYLLEADEVYLIWKYPSEWFLNEPKSKFREDYFEIHNINPGKTTFIALCFKDVTSYTLTCEEDDLTCENKFCLLDIENDFVDGRKGLLFNFLSGMTIRIEAKEVFFKYDFKI